MPTNQQRANKTDADNGSYGICRVIGASRSPSPDPRRKLKNMRSLILLLTVFLVGCDSPKNGLLLPKQALTPSYWSGPILGRQLPLYAWTFQLPEESPKAKYRITLELRRAGQAPEILCELTPEYLQTRTGRDVVVSVNRPYLSSNGMVTDTQFQIRLLDSAGEATAIVANNNNCPNSKLRKHLNGAYKFPDTVPTASSKVLLWEIVDEKGGDESQVFLTATKL